MQNKYIVRDRCILLLLLFIFSIGTYSLFGNIKNINFSELANYQHRVKGQVTDSNGIPIPGVNVGIKGTSYGTFTNKEGYFYVDAAPTDVLTLSYIGFKPLQVVVGSSEELSLVLEEDVTNLEAVTVNAGYYTVSEKERTGSISSITATDIENQPVTEVLATMQGRMPGVFITQDTGVPGGSFQIQIRGQNSLRTGGNNPLYIIDGIPYSSEIIGSEYIPSAIVGLKTPLNNIDPSSIISIEVLKDADATAIYGSRGANGVVLITTKRGSPGKSRFQLKYTYGTGRAQSFFEFMDTPEYIQMRKEAYTNDGITEYPANAYDVNGTWDQNRYTDWQEVFIGGTSEFTDINGSISGGSEQTQYFLSGNYHKETTVFPGKSAYYKFGVHSSITHLSKDKRLNLNLSSGYTLQDNNLPGTSFISNVSLSPNAPALYNVDGSLNWENSTWINPLSILEEKYSSDSRNLISNLLLSYKILPGLEIRTSMGYTDIRFYEQKVSPSTMTDPARQQTSEHSRVRKNNEALNSWIIEPQLSYTKKLEGLKTSLLIGSTFQSQTSTQLALLGSNYINNSLIENLTSAATKFIYTDNKTEYKYNAIFGRFNLNYLDRYIINLTGRRDGSSRFGPGKQFANFGAIGGAWLFSEEPWLKSKLGILSFGKLRGSYGVTGNDQIGDYQYLDTYTVNSTNYDGKPVMEPSRLFNPSFSWEENKKMEVALEAGFFHDRILLTAVYYKNRSSNQLVGIPLPGTTGFSSIQANLNATVENRGWEFSLQSKNFSKNNFLWTTSFNVSLNRNDLIAFPGLEESTYASRYVIGEPLNIKKTYNYKGIDPKSGLYQFTDYNGDGVLSYQDDREAIRDFTPQYFGGLQNSIRYKGFTLNFLFQFVKQDNYLGYRNMGRPGSMRNHLVIVKDRWQNPGDIATYQAYTTGSNSELSSAHTKYTQSNAVIGDASYLRLKNISLSYKLPDTVIRGLKCTFILRGQNLLTITDYEGFDPESQYTNSLPLLQVLTTGIQLSF